MAVRRIMRMGHPVLRKIARPVTLAELRSPAMAQFVTDLTDTLHDYGGIGLAAPQVGESIRLLLLEIPGGRNRYGEMKPLPLAVYVNPDITVVDPTPAGYWEGCLSIPGLRGFVERPQHLRVRYQDLAGDGQEIELLGFQATAFQHEFDHLNGMLYLDRIIDRTRISFDEEYIRYHTGAALD